METENTEQSNMSRAEAAECVWQEFCPDCKGYGFAGEGCIPQECEIFKNEVEQTLEDEETCE